MRKVAGRVSGRCIKAWEVAVGPRLGSCCEVKCSIVFHKFAVLISKFIFDRSSRFSGFGVYSTQATVLVAVEFRDWPHSRVEALVRN